MVRRCVAGCDNTAGLHSFPADFKIRRQWLHALGLEDREFPPRAGVCKLHFTEDYFSNAMEVEMGFSTQLALKSGTVRELRVQFEPAARIDMAQATDTSTSSTSGEGGGEKSSTSNERSVAKLLASLESLSILATLTAAVN